VDDSKTLSENNITLPGPMARRNGQKTQLLYGLVLEVLAREERKVLERQKDLDAQVASQQREERQAEDQKYVEVEFERFVQRSLGLQQEQIDQKKATDPEFEVPPNVLEPCGEDIRAAVQALMHGSGGSSKVGYAKAGGVHVHHVFRNVNPELQRRYNRAREQLQAAVARIRPHRFATANAVLSDSQTFGVLGDYDAGVNESPLWHGTPRVEGAGGICKTGFDMAYAGAQGTAYSPGFYFAGDFYVSAGYCREPFHVNAKYTNMRAMLLCRVVCGNLKEVNKAPNEKEKEELTAQCLGPGGTFGSGSDFHAVLGGGWAYVCMHRDQVYPEYVVLYSIK